MHDSSLNIFLALSRWAHYQEENFTTESFFFLLKAILDKNPEEGRELLSFISGPDIPKDIDLSNPKFDLQALTEGEGIPDARITTKDCLLLIEVKVSALFSDSQRKAYEREIERSTKRYKKLVLLTRDPVRELSDPGRIRLMRWYQLADYLETEIAPKMNDPTLERFMSDFLQYLEYKGLAITKVCSPLSEAIKSLRFPSREEDLLPSRIRSFARIEKKPELKSLVALLKMMAAALSQVRPEHKPLLDSGTQDEGWLGYNFNKMEYFFVVELKAKDTIYLQAYGRKMNESGRADLRERYGDNDETTRWYYRIKLDEGFFDFAKTKQMEFIEGELRNGFEMAEKFSDEK